MRSIDQPAAPQPPRVVSIDALRGLNMFWIMGFDGAMESLGQMSEGKTSALSRVGRFLGSQFNHAPWEGLRFYDLIFPLFIFLAGVSIVLSLPRLVEREGSAKAHLRILRRSFLLYVMGVIGYGGIGQHFTDVRLLGILQRIAICYLFTSLMFLHLNLRALVGATVIILAGYWALMTFVPVPGIGAGSYAPDANLANWVDRNYLPGRLWDVTRDPEGLLSTLPSIATCLFGVLAGLLLRDNRLSEPQKTFWLGAGGVLLLAAGYLWALQFPIIKAIWTSSFVLVAAGYSMLMLAAMHQIVDIWRWRRWATVFIWIGANALALYFVNDIANFYSVAARLAGGDLSDYLDKAVASGAGGVLLHAVMLVVAIAFARFLYRHKIFLRV